MASAKQHCALENHLSPLPRARQMIKQYPLRRGSGLASPSTTGSGLSSTVVPNCVGNERVLGGPHNKQAIKSRQQKGPSAPLEFPIHDLEPLQALNAYRRDLGLGPTRNLISCAIYNCDPTTVAGCYERLAMRRSFGCALVNPPAQPNGESVIFHIPWPAVRSSVADDRNTSAAPSTQDQDSSDPGSDVQSPISE